MTTVKDQARAVVFRNRICEWDETDECSEADPCSDCSAFVADVTKTIEACIKAATDVEYGPNH